MADDQQTKDQKTEDQKDSGKIGSDQKTSEPENQNSDAPISSVTPGSSGSSEEKKAETPKKETKPVSVNLEKIIEQIEKLSVLELADLVHALEDRFGVSASAPIAAVTGAAGSAAGEPAEEKTTFNVILSSGGANKIAAIKAVRELNQTLGLKEAKDLVEAAPKPVLEGVNKATAEEAKQKLTAAGATVELQ